MNQKAKTRFMTRVVRFCIGFTAVMIVACYVARWFGVDTSHELTVTATVFGGELLLTVVLRLTEKEPEKKEGGGEK